ncbi:hypothetical protein [Leptospira bandrabouensis]|uniref:Uncharacterized protein n=1 Tax=Leptospira bandrabouensis TaxID=2484903 RepID=A0A6H3NL64_9LEPT|nr:hypothetical protein [Leptospira bandrabouensis]TGN09984.1 hypothetical protein EHR07_00460 [Leptospira bandrabouensis]TGN12358.1 hypothetical protein EHR08_13330 [Leptospira bandrabouensis]
MANLPSQKRILEQDLGSDVPSWTRKLLSPLNSFFESLYSAFNRDITFRENIRCDYRDIIVTTTANYDSREFTPIKFKNNLKERVDTILISQISEDRAVFTPVYESTSLAWNEYNKEITIHYISGLEPNKSYKLKLLLF